ncbi:MAG: hypothetical protein GF355_13260 [Candidatus Eisenbacteria bacterium]|nr:hypothetical protein [Candidatus Eisenbacteria bacterium]
MFRRIALMIGLTALSLVQLQCLLIPSDEEHGQRAPNQRPHVEITGGVFTSDPAGVSYRVDFRWHGWDNDGVVTGFEWAIDDTTLERAWTPTTEFSNEFSFRATTEDQADSSFYDWHRFYIRALDNDFAHSEIDERFFNARTIAPTTEITFPVWQEGSTLLRRPRSFNVTWEGEDLDAANAEKIPVFYEYKLVEVTIQDNPEDYVQFIHASDNVFLDTLSVGDRRDWIRIPASQTTLPLSELDVPQLYVLAVRAIDEAGAVEPTLEVGENFIVFEVTEFPCKPLVTISESRLGRHRFPIDGEVWRVEVPSNTEIRFEWTGDATECGARTGNVNYGLDIEDPGDATDSAPNGIGGWIGWGRWKEMQSPLIFPDREGGKTHNFYMKMLDESGNLDNMQFCWIQIRVVSFPFNKTALMVDDATVGPAFFPGGDEAHDAFRTRVTSCINRFAGTGEEIPTLQVYGNNESNLNPAQVRLETVAQYRLLIWNTWKGGGYLGSGLAVNEFERRVLSSYVGAGGRLYLYGWKPVGCLAGDRFTYDGDGLCPDVENVDEPAWDEESFIWAFLHLTNCVKSISGASQQIDGWIGSRSAHPLYPDLHINRDVWDPDEVVGQDVRGGVIWYEIYRASRSIPIEPEPGLDTLYTLETYNYQGDQSQLEGYPIALRYQSTAEDSALGRAHGRVFLQMFPFFVVPEGPATEAACKAITWIMTGRDE